MALCPNCFREKKAPGACPACGFDPAGQREKYPLALHPGAILNGRFTVGRVLGQGGFGVTYISQDFRSGQRYAIKEYLPMELATRGMDGTTLQVFSADREENFTYGKEQFLSEAKTLAAFIGDEHIVRIHSYFEENGTAYFVMDYVDGPSLDGYMKKRGGRLTPAEAGRLLLPLMESLGHVHERGIVHRDIAPDNILLENGKSAKLIDFGAARYSTGEKSRSLDVILKHGFAPYEQYMRRGRQGPWTDVYALAATFYYAITGKVPPEAVERRDEDQLIPPSRLGVNAGAEVERVLGKALAVLAEDRYQSMAEFHREMQAALEAMPDSAAGNTGSAGPGGKKKKPVVFALAAVLVLAIAGVFALRGRKLPAAPALTPEPTAAAETAAPTAAPTPTPAPAEEPPEETEALPEETAAPAQPAKSLDEVRAGDVVLFGSYEQDNDERDGKEEIEWLVLDRDGDRLLVISKYALDCQKYHAEGYETSWRKCSIRYWVNNTFMKAAFTKEEKAAIPTVTVTADANPRYDTNPGEDTEDQVFLLSIADTEKYFSSMQGELCCKPTAYAKQQGCFVNHINGNCWWWLRTPGSRARNAVYVSDTGTPDASGNAVGVTVGWGSMYGTEYTGHIYTAVRPAMWIDLAAESGARPQVAPVQSSQGRTGPVEPKRALKSLSEAEAGDLVLYGSYEQDNNTSNGSEDIEWLVLKREATRLLVVSRYALYTEQFHAVSEEISWPRSTLRQWVYGVFQNDAFTAAELKSIPLIALRAEENPIYRSDAGGNTDEQVFLMGINEVNEYFPTAEQRLCLPTPYAKARGCYTNPQTGCCGWWLRTPGYNAESTMLVGNDGELYYCGAINSSKTVAVRPSMWIDLPE